MLMSVVTRDDGQSIYPELAGSRVLITGVTAAAGVDVARAFAERKAQLIIQTPEVSPEMTEVGALLAQSAADLKMFAMPIEDATAAVRFAQTAAQVYGGIDIAINLIPVDTRACDTAVSDSDAERLVSRTLENALRITEVTSNRMRLMMTEGMILNAVLMPVPTNGRQAAMAGLIRDALATITIGEARRSADRAIRINATGPRALTTEPSPGATIASEQDLAALALHLASRKGRSLTGYVFDAAGVANRRCG